MIVSASVAWIKCSPDEVRGIREPEVGQPQVGQLGATNFPHFAKPSCGLLAYGAR
jgi:hypothetical protein